MVKRKKSLKIAIFHLGFFFSGGGEKLVIEEARGLQKMGHQVTIFAPVVDKKQCFPDLWKNIRVKQLLAVPLTKFPFRDFLLIGLSVVVAPLTFWRFSKFDVFLGANQPGPLICWFLGKLLKKPYVIYLAQPTRLVYPRKIDRLTGFGKGSFDLFFFLAQIFKPLVKWLDYRSIRSAGKILVNGEYMSKIISQTYRVKVVVCPAGCYVPAKLERTIKKPPYLLITNRHYPQKRFDYLISAMPFILRRFPEISLVITGRKTAYTDYLKTLTSHLGLDNKVYFLGLVSEVKLNQLYRQAAVYVYTSPCEDFGMGVIEAMARGAPVVAWNYAGPATTVISGKTGYLAKPYEIADLATKINLLLGHPDLNRRMGNQAWKHVHQYSYQKHLEILEKNLFSVV